MGVKKAVLTIASFLVLSSVSFAQKDTTSRNQSAQFYFINGYSLAYVHSISETSWLRFQLNLSLSARGSDGDGDWNQTSQSKTNSIFNSSNTNRTENSNYQSIGFQFQFLSTILKQNDFTMFYGIGPSINLNRDYYQYHHSFRNIDMYSSSYPPMEKNETSSLQYSLSLGVIASIGVEARVTNSLSINCEYSAFGLYSWYKDKSENNYDAGQSQHVSITENISGTTWNVGLGGIRLGISYHF